MRVSYICLSWLDSNEWSTSNFLDFFLHLQSSIAKGPLVLYISSFVITFIVKKFNKVVGTMVRMTSAYVHRFLFL